MARRSARTETQTPADADQWDGDNEGENAQNDAQDTEAADAARRAEAQEGSGIAQAGPALTEAQLEGLDPIDRETHLDQAARRGEMTNMQTDHEAMNGLDGVSGTPNPGVTEQQSAAHTQPGARGSDMSGNPPKADPLAALSREQVEGARKALTQADRQDVANGKAGNEVATERSAGWRTARQLGVHKATLDALVEAGRVEVDSAPGMSHMPETGRLYRIKRDRG